MCTHNNENSLIYPQRIVCTSNESVDILVRFGCAGRIVGRPSESTGDAVAHTVDIGGFATTDIKKVIDLKPDLVITYSDMQYKAAGELIRNCLDVLALNQLDIAGIYKSIGLLGCVTGCTAQAGDIITFMKNEIDRVKNASKLLQTRPRVYFEEWYKPYVTATRWISELVGIAGGCDIFDEKSHLKNYMEREVTSEEIIDADPDIIIASWCGIPVDTDSIGNRPGWDRIRAVKLGRIHSVPSNMVLQPGPRIIKGLGIIEEIIRK